MAQRGRPKKKILDKNVSILNFEKQIANSPVTKTNNVYGYVKYGDSDDYCYRLLDLYNTSVTMRACVDFATNAIIGEGINWEEMNVEDVPNPNYYTTWTTFLYQIAFDFVMYNAFAFQVIKNKDGKTYSFFHQPIDTVRLEEKDEDGVSNFAYISKDFTSPTKYPPVKVPIFGFQDESVIKSGQVYLFYYSRYNPISAYYGLASYSAGISAIQAEAEFQAYDLRSIVNGFVSTGSLSLPSVETDAERNQILKDITNMFCGAQNSNRLLIQFRNNDDERGVEFTPFAASTEHVDLFDKSNERTINRIMAAFKIPSKALIGYPADDLGFSDSGAYMEEAFRLYNINVANQNRKEMLDVLNKMLNMNGIDVKIVLKPLVYNYDMQQQNTTGDTVEDEKTSQDGVTDETATEKENNT